MRSRTYSAPIAGAVVILCAVTMTGHLALAQTNSLRFDDIRVVGNERMSDSEVLELCDISASQSYDDAALQQLVNCLGQTGRFKEISLRTEGRDLLIDVNEAPRFIGFLDISVSADTERGLSAKLEIEDRDLFGSGLEGNLALEVAREEQSASATLSNADFMGRGWRGGLSLSYQNVNYDDQRFSYRRGSLSSFLTVPINEDQGITFRTGVQADELYNLALAASPILQREAGKRISPFVAMDYRGVFLPAAMPQSRFEMQASQVFFGIGQDHLFSSTRLRGQAAAVAIPDRLNVSLSLEGGHIANIGNAGPSVLDRFQLGGASLRGFAPRGIGPTDGNDRLGGTNYAVSSFETRSPLFALGQSQIAGGVFAEVGSVWGLNDRAGFIDPVDDSLNIRASAGVSLTTNIGNVPVSLYYAEPIRSAPRDRLQSFGLSLSSRF
jgi:outer membrane protein insertion porin family